MFEGGETNPNTHSNYWVGEGQKRYVIFLPPTQSLCNPIARGLSYFCHLYNPDEAVVHTSRLKTKGLLRKKVNNKIKKFHLY